MFGSVTSSRARVETSIPRKHGPAIAGYESVCSCTVSLYTCSKLWLMEFLWYYSFNFCFSVGFEEILWECFAGLCYFSEYACLIWMISNTYHKKLHLSLTYSLLKYHRPFWNMLTSVSFAVQWSQVPALQRFFFPCLLRLSLILQGCLLFKLQLDKHIPVESTSKCYRIPMHMWHTWAFWLFLIFRISFIVTYYLKQKGDSWDLLLRTNHV